MVCKLPIAKNLIFQNQNKAQKAQNIERQMKLNKNTVKTGKVVKAKTPAIVSNVKATVKKAVKTVKAKAAKIVQLGKLILVVRGKRGLAARYGIASKQADVITFTPLQRNNGLTEKKAEPCYIDAKGTITGSKTAKCQAGTYANGKSSGAIGELLTVAQFQARSKPCSIKWNIDSKPTHGRYIGNPHEKGMLAVCDSNGFYWQMEQDSNSHNKHERGHIAAMTKNGKLEVVA